MASRKVFVNIVLCILVLATIKLSAQDSTNFFPHHIGDMWEYYFTDFIDDDTVQVFVIADTLDSLGSHHVTQAARAINPVVPHTYHFPDTGEYILDTLGQVFSIAHGGLLYKLHANRNDIWIVRLLGGTMYEIAKVKNVSQDTLFSVPIITKEIWYYFTEDTTDTTIWLHVGTDIIADKFGLIFRGDPESGAFSILKGAVINDVLYGDTALVSIHPTLTHSIPEHFHLYQNYPNPFNPRTAIPFQLNSSGRISVMIYDVAGRLVRRLIDNQWYPIGEHEIIWDGKSQKGGDAASGIYLYRIQAGDFSQVRRMLLIK